MNISTAKIELIKAERGLTNVALVSRGRTSAQCYAGELVPL